MLQCNKIPQKNKKKNPDDRPLTFFAGRRRIRFFLTNRTQNKRERTNGKTTTKCAYKKRAHELYKTRKFYSTAGVYKKSARATPDKFSTFFCKHRGATNCGKKENRYNEIGAIFFKGSRNYIKFEFYHNSRERDYITPHAHEPRTIK